MPKWYEVSKTGRQWLDGQEWEIRRIQRAPEPEPATSTPEPKKRLFGRGEKTMPTTVKTARVKILRGVASSRWAVEPGQCLELAEDIVDQLIRSGSARLARPDEPLSYATEYLPG
jgi:hypothetical protein